jgi:hypothetical protein
MRLLPDASLYRDQGATPCLPRQAVGPSGGGSCHHLTFSPNPTFEPPDMEANTFRGLAGDLWIDQAQERLTRLACPGVPWEALRHRQCRFRLGHPGQAGQRRNHPPRSIRHRQRRLGTHHPEAEPERQSPDAQIAGHPIDGASQPLLASPIGSGLPQGDSTLGEIRRARRSLMRGIGLVGTAGRYGLQPVHKASKILWPLGPEVRSSSHSREKSPFFPQPV